MFKLTDIRGIGPALVKALDAQGVRSVIDLAKAEPAKLLAVPRIGVVRAAAMIAAAQELIASGEQSDAKDVAGAVTGEVAGTGAAKSAPKPRGTRARAGAVKRTPRSGPRKATKLTESAMPATSAPAMPAAPLQPSAPVAAEEPGALKKAKARAKAAKALKKAEALTKTFEAAEKKAKKKAKKAKKKEKAAKAAKAMKKAKKVKAKKGED